MKKQALVYTFGLLVVLGSIFAFTIAPTAVPVEETPATFKWYTLEEALKANETAPKKFFIDVYTDWCGWCKVMDRKTFSQAEVQSYLAEHFYPVKLDAEQREAINFKGKDYQYVSAGKRGINQIALQLLGNRPSYPSIVYLDENLETVHLTKGFKQQAQLQPELEFVAENHYKTTSWQAFSAK